MSANDTSIPIKKSPLTTTKTVILNISKMLNARGYIDTKNINRASDKLTRLQENDTYSIELDKDIQPDTQKAEYIRTFNKRTIYIRFIHMQVQGITKIPMVKEFLDLFHRNHKFLIFDSISDRAKNMILNQHLNTEVFQEWTLMMNILEHVDSPKYELLTNEDDNVLESYNVQRNQLPKMLMTDPIVDYFRLKPGQIIRVLRPSEQSGYSVAYRIVVGV